MAANLNDANDGHQGVNAVQPKLPGTDSKSLDSASGS